MNTPHKPATPKDLRSFGLIFGSIVIALFGLLIPWIVETPIFTRMWPWHLGGAVIILGLIIPISLKPLYIVWMKFGDIAGFVNTRIILFILFYIIVFPVGLIMKIFGADPMSRKLEADSDSYRIVRKRSSKQHMEKPY